MIPDFERLVLVLVLPKKGKKPDRTELSSTNKAREERKDAKKEAASIEACWLSAFPASAGEAEVEESSDSEPPTSDLPFDLEEGDQVLVVPKSGSVRFFDHFG